MPGQNRAEIVGKIDLHAYAFFVKITISSITAEGEAQEFMAWMRYGHATGNDAPGPFRQTSFTHAGPRATPLLSDRRT